MIVQYIDRIDDRVFVWSAVTLAALVPSGIGNEHAHALSHTHTCVTQHIDRIDDRVFVWSGITLAAPIIRFQKKAGRVFRLCSRGERNHSSRRRGSGPDQSTRTSLRGTNDISKSECANTWGVYREVIIPGGWSRLSPLELGTRSPSNAIWSIPRVD